MRREAFTIVTKCYGVACSTVHCLWNRVVRMHAHGHIIPTKKFWETSYVSIGVRPQGNQEHPIIEATDSKKAGSIIGGVKDNGASLDC